MLISPEVLAEQVMGYVVGASEMIPTLHNFPEQTYSLAILPQGPHFYTGLLWAAGYLLLDSAKKKVLLLTQQEIYPDIPLIDISDYEIMGKTWKKNRSTIQKIAKNIGADIVEKKEISELVSDQLPFLNVISDVKDIVHISLGTKIKKKYIQNLLTWINKNSQEYAVICFTNIEIEEGFSLKGPKGKKYLSEYFQRAMTQKNVLIGIFKEILDYKKRNPEIVAYVQPEQNSTSPSSLLRYVCIVG